MRDKYTMTQDTQSQSQQTSVQNQSVTSKTERKPNEHIGIVFSETLTIRDPNSGEILLQQRCS